MKYLQVVGLLLVSGLISQTVLADKVYTWTDTKGVVHFGERPPQNVKATLVKTRTGYSAPTPRQTAAAEPAATAQTAIADERVSLKDPERCAKAKENMAILNSVARIKTTNAEGIAVYLTEEDKVKQRQSTQLIINQACD